MGDVITSMILLMEDMSIEQTRLSFAYAQLAAAAAQASNQINNQTFSGDTASASGACANWNTSEAYHSIVFFTVKNYSGPSTQCSNAIADAFIAQVSAAMAVSHSACGPSLACAFAFVQHTLRLHQAFASLAQRTSQLNTDYKANVDPCPDSALKIGQHLSGTPTRDKDYGCTALPSATNPSSSAMYYAVITSYSHFPCAQHSVSKCGRASRQHAGLRKQRVLGWGGLGAPALHRQPTFAGRCRQVMNIFSKAATTVCGGPFAGTCADLRTMTDASAQVVDVSALTVWDGSGSCTQCLNAVAPTTACYPGGATWA